MILIIGLGNIGNEYENTRHNIGFTVIDNIKDHFDFPSFKEKGKFIFSKTKINGIDVIIAKPTTYMNLSGEAVLSLSSLYKIKPEDIIVIHDDLDIKTSEIRIKQGGGNGGHNGLKSIDSKIGPNYHRIRIGIDHPRNNNPQIDVSSYVLGKFTKQEKELLNQSIQTITDNFEKIIKKDLKL